MKKFKSCQVITPLLLSAMLIACGSGGGGGNGWNGGGSTTSDRQLQTFSQGSTGFFYNPLTLVDNFIYIGTSHHFFRDPANDNYFFKLDSNLNKVWGYSLGSKEVKGGASLDSNDNIYFVVEEGRLKGDASNSIAYLYSLDNNGNFRWSNVLDSLVIGFSNPAIAINDTIYVGAEKFYAFDTNGNELWTYGNNMRTNITPIIDPSGNIYFIGTIKTSVPPGWIIPVANVISLTKDGTERWIFSIPYGSSASSPAFSTDYSKIFVAVINKIYCLESSNGNKVWEFTPGGMVGGFIASPAVDDQNNVYIGNHADKDSVLYAIKADGSEILWKNGIGADLYSSPALGNNNTVYVGSEITNRGRLHALDMNTGDFKWSASLGGDVTGSSPAVSDDGTLYIATMACDECQSGYVYSFDTDSTGLLPNAGSPRFHGGNSNTGRRE